VDEATQRDGQSAERDGRQPVELGPRPGFERGSNDVDAGRRRARRLALVLMVASSLLMIALLCVVGLLVRGLL
jgi:hypothetical protein